MQCFAKFLGHLLPVQQIPTNSDAVHEHNVNPVGYRVCFTMVCLSEPPDKGAGRFTEPHTINETQEQVCPVGAL